MAGATVSKRLLLVLMLVALAAPATAVGAAAPPGAAISDSLEYVERVPSSDMIVEGKIDRSRAAMCSSPPAATASAPTT